MKNFDHLYINGNWSGGAVEDARALVDPTTEEAFGTMGSGSVKDVELAVTSARVAFRTFGRWTVQQRLELIDRIAAAYEERLEDFSAIVSQEVGIPVSARAQVSGPLEHMKVAQQILRDYAFETQIRDTIIRREPIGVCGLIAPWNWPIQTATIKVIYALAAGCTVVLKPSDASPAGAVMLAEVMDKAGVPPGVFNLVVGKGRLIGEALTNHPDVDMISFTGSTQAGIKVGEAAARTVKRVSLELGGKSANIVLKDADLEKAARWTIQRGFNNSGQSCHAPTRLLVHQDQLEQLLPFLVDEIDRFVMGDPRNPTTTMGPLVNAAQFESVQGFIHSGIEEGARLLTGGPGRPDGLNRGYFTRPTVFSDVSHDMKISREEIFGPVLSVIPYATEEHALEMANDTPLGLGGYVFSSDRRRGYEFACEIRAGRIGYNGAATNSWTPMGGYKQSGIGREMGIFGLEEYLETKSIYGFVEEAQLLPVFGH